MSKAVGTTRSEGTEGLVFASHHSVESPEFKPDLLSYSKPHVVSPSHKLKPGWMKVTGNRIKQINDMSACTDLKQLPFVVAKV